MSARADIAAIGLRIRERRMALGMTQASLAKRLDVTAQAVSKWETGMGYPDTYVLPDIAQVLQMSVDELLGVIPMREDVSAESILSEEEEILSSFADESEQAFADAERWVEEATAKPEEPIRLTMDPDETDRLARGFEKIELEADRMMKDAETEEKRIEEKISSIEDAIHYAGTPKVDADFKIEDVDEQINNTFNDAFGTGLTFGADLSHSIKSIVRNALSMADRALRQNGGAPADPKVQTVEYDGTMIDSLELEFNGSGELRVNTSTNGVWNASIKAPEEMFKQIVCQQRGNTLVLKIPSPQAVGLHGGRHKVGVMIDPGFTLGKSLKLVVRGSADTEIAPDFESSDISVSGSGDVHIANAGVLNYRISGSGDLHAEDVQDAKVRISGSGDVHVGLATGGSSVHISGSGDFSAQAMFGELDASVSGSGDFDIGEGHLDYLSLRVAGSGNFDGARVDVEDAKISVSGGGDVVLGSVHGRLEKSLSRGASLRIVNK